MLLDISKIVLLMAEGGLTYTSLSQKCGVSRQQLSTIIARGSCSPITGGKLAAGLGVSVSDIMVGVSR